MFPGEGGPLSNVHITKRDPVEPEPVGTIIMCAFRVKGYRPDCDGSLMAELAQIDKDGEETGWTENSVGLYPDTDLVVIPEELERMFQPNCVVGTVKWLGEEVNKDGS